MPAATYVHLYNLPLVTALPEMPVATEVWLKNLPLVTAKPIITKHGVIYRDSYLWR
jgi:hypothetical protein